MRAFHAVLAAACVACADARANELTRVYELALANDTQIAAALHARDAAVEARPQARSYLLPQVTSQYQYLKGHEKGFQRFPGAIDDDGDPNTPPVEAELKTPADDKSKQESWGVTLNQALFDWNAFKRYDQAGTQVALAEARYRNAQQQLALRTATAYFDMLAAADSLRYTRAEKEAVDRQLDQAHRRFEVGLSAITDVQEAQARYDLTVAQEIQADQTLANTRQALQVITGPVEYKEVPLREEIPLTPPNPPMVDTWVSAAATHNLDLVASNLTAEIAGKDVGIARAGHYPTVSLIAEYQDQDQVQGNQEQSLHGPAFGAQLNVPIFQGFLVQSRIRQAQATEEQRKSERLGVARDVERQTRDAYLAVMAGAARVKALKQAVVSNNTALEASQTGLEVGTRTAVDVLNAQSALYSAQRDYSRARYDYLLAVLRLKSAAGSLEGKDLDQIDALLLM